MSTDVIPPRIKCGYMKTEPDPDDRNPKPEAQTPEPDSHPPFPEETALAFFARHLDELKWKYRRLSERPALFSGFNGDNVQWDFNLTAREVSLGLFQLGVNAFIPNKAVPARRVAITELLTRINFELSLGCFEMNLADGEIRFRTSVILPASDIAPGIVEHLLRSNICILDERYLQIMAVLYGGVSPEDALKVSTCNQQPATSNQPPPGAGPRFDFN